MVMAQETANLVRLSVGSLSVGFDMNRVLGVERADRIKPSDKLEFVGKIVNRAGEWPVLNLAARLGLDHQPSPRSGQVLLTAIAGRHHGLLVDRVSQVTRLTSRDIQPVPMAIARRGLFFDGIWMADASPVFVLDPDRLIGEVDLFASDDESFPEVAKRTGKKLASDRILAIAQREHPLPGGRLVGFGIPVGSVIEIIDLPVGTVVPGAAEHVREVVQWRTTALPVIDLSMWCGLATPLSTATSRRAAIVRTVTGEKLGLLTGATVKMLTLPLPNIPVRRAITVNAERVAGLFDTNEMTLIIPDLTKLSGR